ncbi:MAG: hypothetical protein EOM37_14870 [Proteobacteria bacterium]|nr:hypothetical protein [Pseudomonadota bacterium]
MLNGSRRLAGLPGVLPMRFGGIVAPYIDGSSPATSRLRVATTWLGWRSPSSMRDVAAMMDSTPLDGALAAVRRGWYVFPLQVGGKEPYERFSWTRLASNSEEQVLAWATMYPESNWAVHCGKSGLAVLDIDVKHGAPGHESLLGLELAHGDLPATFTVKTPSGGEHRYFTGASRSKNGFLPGLDMKAGIEGRSSGYVLLPGSVIDGKRYEIVDGREVAALPGWLPAIMDAKAEPDKIPTTLSDTNGTTAYGQKALELEVGKVAVARKGKRNETLNKASFALGQLVSGGEVDKDTALGALKRAALAAGLPSGEAEKTIMSGFEAGRKEPRSAPVTHAFDNVDEDEEDAPTVALVPVEYVIDGFVSTGVLYLGGGHGVGKSSFLAPLTALVSGELPPSIESGLVATLHRVVIYFAEDRDQIRRCRHALAKHHSLVENKERFVLRSAKRRTPEQVGQLIKKLVERHTIPGPCGYGVRPLTVFDTSNASFELENENDSQEIGRIISAIKEHSDGAPVWIIGHVAKALLRADFEALTGRGSGAWEGDANQTCFVFNDDGAPENVRFLGVKKTRFEPVFREARLETCTDCETVSTPWGETQNLVLRHGVPSRSSKAERLRAREERKLEQQQVKTSEAEGFVIDALRDHEVLTKTRLEEIVKERGAPRKATRDAISGLIDRGAIEQNAEVMAGAIKRQDGLRLAEGWTW